MLCKDNVCWCGQFLIKSNQNLHNSYLCEQLLEMKKTFRRTFHLTKHARFLPKKRTNEDHNFAQHLRHTLCFGNSKPVTSIITWATLAAPRSINFGGGRQTWVPSSGAIARYQWGTADAEIVESTRRWVQLPKWVDQVNGVVEDAEFLPFLRSVCCGAGVCHGRTVRVCKHRRRPKRKKASRKCVKETCEVAGEPNNCAVDIW